MSASIPRAARARSDLRGRHRVPRAVLRSSAWRCTGCRASIRSSSQELGWSRQQVTSGNAYSKIVVAIAFGFIAGRMVDRVRAAPPDARRHRDGGRRAGRAVVRHHAGRVLPVLRASTRSATSAAGRCPTRCCCRAGSTRAAARRWASRISASASAARWCRCSLTR